MIACAACQAAVPVDALACPACRTLVHAARLKDLQRELEAATTIADQAAQRRTIDAMLALLPSGSRQHVVLRDRLSKLPGETPKPKPPSWIARLGPIGVVVLVLWKAKVFLLPVLGYGKLLLLGLTKGTTFLSMLVSLGLYWSLYGWKFAAGLIASLYVHEMGHVAALRARGIPATAPMFVPGLGAFVRLTRAPATAVDDSRVGLAGPIWGLAAALAAWAASVAVASPLLLAIAHWGAQLNLFNLIPIWQLDGARGLRSLSRVQRWVLVAVMIGSFIWFQQGMLLIVAIVTFGHAALGRPNAEGDRGGLVRFGLLVALLGLVAATTLHGPSPAP